ncbi:MAG: hypothetical protein ACYDCG_06175 [Candidatus Acidiferrales bacterium]
MNPAFLLLAGFALVLLILLGLVLRDPRRLGKPDADLSLSEEPDRRHVTYFPQMRQALSAEDFVFLSSLGSRELTRRVRKERQRIALAFLSCLRSDFLKLWRLARVIASMSPQVGMAQEFARLRLGLVFYLHYEMVRVKFLFGFAPLPELGSLSEVVSRLAIRLETAMNELGERAALAAKLASSLDGRDLNTP